MIDTGRKFFLAGILVSVLLGASLFYSTIFFRTNLREWNLNSKLISLSESIDDLRFAAVRMNYGTESEPALMEEFTGLKSNLNENFESVLKDSIYLKISPNIQSRFRETQENWHLLEKTMNDEKLSSLLRQRIQLSPEERLSLSNSADQEENAKIGKNPSIQKSFQNMESFRHQIADFEDFFEKNSTIVLDIAEQIHRGQIFRIIAIPVLALLFSIVILFFLSSQYTFKIRRLRNGLAKIAEGNFSKPLAVSGNDEFHSLSLSANHFIQTLAAKLESFRLIIQDTGRSLNEKMDSNKMEETLVGLAVQETGADGGALYKVGSDTGELVLSVLVDNFRPPFPIIDLPLNPDSADIDAILRSNLIQRNTTILGQAAFQGTSKFVQNVKKVQDLEWIREENDPFFLSSVMVLPLRIGATVFGVLVITSSKQNRIFSELEYINMQSFAEIASIALDSLYKYSELLDAVQLKRELGIAEKIQKDLLPHTLPQLPTSEVKYLSRNITGLNGDYFDAYPLGKTKMMITICEVAGRGVPAGLVMVMLRTILRLVATDKTDAQTILTLLNQNMTERVGMENYASAGILVLDEDGTFTYSSAAHYPLQILRADTMQYEAVQTVGIPIGIDTTAEYQKRTGSLNKNDILLIHTDGIPESRNKEGEHFTVGRLLQSVHRKAVSKPEEILDALKKELEDFEKDAEQKDDQTLIILKYKGKSNS